MVSLFVSFLSILAPCDSSFVVKVYSANDSLFLSGCHISCPSLNTWTVTDENGSFVIDEKTRSGCFELRFSHLGYLDTIIPIDSILKSRIVFLVPETLNLKEVLIIPRRFEKASIIGNRHRNEPVSYEWLSNSLIGIQFQPPAKLMQLIELSFLLESANCSNFDLVVHQFEVESHQKRLISLDTIEISGKVRRGWLNIRPSKPIYIISVSDSSHVSLLLELIPRDTKGCSPQLLLSTSLIKKEVYGISRGHMSSGIFVPDSWLYDPFFNPNILLKLAYSESESKEK